MPDKAFFETAYFETARAKVNLTLHVGRVISDLADPFYNYHPIDSLVTFADIGDELRAEISEPIPAQSAQATSLTITGPYGESLKDDDPDNLVLKAYARVARHVPLPAIDFYLLKNLPVASGLGGGSANAAATLRILKRIATLPDAVWKDIAISLGADVPVCMLQQTARMSGIGENVMALEALEPVYGVLINPNIAVSTVEIFKAYDKGTPPETPRPQKITGGLLSRARDGGNDLEPVTCELEAKVNQILIALKRTSSCQLARMSGSGASCFGLYSNLGAAQKAFMQIQKLYAGWWVQLVILGDT